MRFLFLLFGNNNTKGVVYFLHDVQEEIRTKLKKYLEEVFADELYQNIEIEQNHGETKIIDSGNHIGNIKNIFTQIYGPIYVETTNYLLSSFFFIQSADDFKGYIDYLRDNLERHAVLEEAFSLPRFGSAVLKG